MPRKLTTIHEQRRKAIITFACKAFKTEKPTIEEINHITRLMNSYYRLCALEYRICELENNEETHNSKYLIEQNKKRDRWFANLNAKFNEIGFDMRYSGIMPRITVNTPDHCISWTVDTYFYD